MDLAIVSWHYVIYPVISFAIAATFTMLYNGRRRSYTEEIDPNQLIVDAIVAEYSHRLNYIQKKVIELQIRIDNLESRESYQGGSQRSKEPSDADTEISNHPVTSPRESQANPQQHITVSVPARRTELDARSSKSEKIIQDTQNSTMYFILKLLSERPRTSREIQYSIGRTREHTSRLLKRLYESHLVDRRRNNGPYEYTITESGGMRLNAQPNKESGLATDNTADAIVNIHSGP